MFIRIRNTYFPVDSIDQIDEVNGRLRICLSHGIKIDLDPVESERLIKQLDAMSPVRSAQDIPQIGVILSRLAAVESRTMAIHASVSASESKAKAKVKANA